MSTAPEPAPDGGRHRVRLDADLYQMLLDIGAARGTNNTANVLNAVVRQAIQQAHAAEVGPPRKKKKPGTRGD